MLEGPSGVVYYLPNLRTLDIYVRHGIGWVHNDESLQGAGVLLEDIGCPSIQSITVDIYFFTNSSTEALLAQSWSRFDLALSSKCNKYPDVCGALSVVAQRRSYRVSSSHDRSPPPFFAMGHPHPPGPISNIEHSLVVEKLPCCISCPNFTLRTYQSS